LSKDFEFKPATDLHLSFRQRIRSVVRERSIFSLAYSVIWWIGTWLIMRLYFRFTIVGQKNVPTELPFVMISNHSSHLDVVSLLLAVRMRVRDRLFPLAAEDHFFKKTAKAAFTAYAINALPVSRHGGGVEAMKALRERMQQQKCGYILFPEGTRTRDGQMASFKSGVGILIADTDIPVIPCYLRGGFEAFPSSAKFPRPHKLTLVIGEPVRFSHIQLTKEGSIVIAQDLEQRVRALATL
jgi:1-acyl-sn-glycerol-3-phosphate acyltransferase